MEFLRVTEVNFGDCLESFLTQHHVDFILHQLRADKQARVFVNMVQDSNVLG
jgi:hypothetical protein